MNKHSGDVVWRAIGAGAQVLHGQWSSPVAADVNGRMQVLFGGEMAGCGPTTRRRSDEIWRFDGNPKDARWLPRPGVFSRSFIVASPVFAGGRVFVAMGQSPEHGNAPSLIHAISPSGQGDVTASRLLWTSREAGCVVATPIEKEELRRGRRGRWRTGLLSGRGNRHSRLGTRHVRGHLGKLPVCGDRLYVGNEDGAMTILRTGRRKGIAGGDRDGWGALFASVARR